MNKSIQDQDFFARNPKDVAIDLLGKYINTKDGSEKYLIVETEAYYHDESFCYGHGKTAAEVKAKRLVSAPLFERPGTWCVYGGQLLLSTTCDELPDNVLIKCVKDKAGELLGPHPMACSLHLYKTNPDYCGCHNQYSLSKDSTLYLSDGQKIAKFGYCERVNINDNKKMNFKIDGE